MNLGPIHLGPLELLIILVAVLVLFGPKNLPKLGSSIGQAIHGLREGLESSKEEAAQNVEVSEATDTAETTAHARQSDVNADEMPLTSKPAPRASHV